MTDIERILAAGCVVLAYLALCWAMARAHKHRQKVAAEAAAGLLSSDGNTAPLLVAFASQTGYAEQLAWRTAEALKSGGVPARVATLGMVDQSVLAGVQRALFVVSTTGEGDPPDSAMRFLSQVMPATLDLSRLQYGLLALGDRSYTRFCSFGNELHAWLQHQRATPLFDIVTVDNGDEGALRHWQYYLGQLSGQTELPDWTAPTYERWLLADRQLLNAGSVGGGVYKIVLKPTREAAVAWRAGDIAEIGPQPFGDVTGPNPLPHREYSIASLPADRQLELIVRQMHHPDGHLGLGSGWLTVHAPLGGEIAVRVRENRSFHPPPDDRPMILIGNGTGIAGLRAHLKSRAAQGHKRNWLVFGERSARHDFLFQQEIEDWQASGVLERLDVAFSRDQAERLYVQHKLHAAAEELRAWMEQGAAIYVCGSLEGMSTGVANVLNGILGVDRLEQLAAEGRYRRDVY